MTAMVEVRNLVKHYKVNSGLWRDLTGAGRSVQAVSGVSFSVQQSEVVGLVGESGCGKTTLGKMLVRLEAPTAGSLMIADRDPTLLRGPALREFRRSTQMVFQDPFESLNPRMTVLDIVAQPLHYLKLANSRADMHERALRALSRVELLPAEQFAGRFPHQLSGGQRQRVAIARALVIEPRFIVADEPVSMLDVSVRASVVNLLQRLNRETGIAILLITHDLATAVVLCGTIMVMYLGKLVEILPAHGLVERARHPYTQLLLASVPDLLRPPAERPLVEESVAATVPNAIAPPSGCRFHPRCPMAVARCAQQEPALRDIADRHRAACHLLEA